MSKMRLAHIYDHYKINGVRSLLKEILHYKRSAIIIEKNLEKVIFNDEAFVRNKIEFAELTEEIINNRNYYFNYKNRQLKAIINLGNGYGGHCILKGQEIIGEIYNSPKDRSEIKFLNKDIEFFNLNIDENCVYSFDNFVVPEYRGDNVSAMLMNNHLWALYKKGFRKAYGYYRDDNLAAKWNAKVCNGWMEKQKAQVSRFFIKRILHSMENI